MTFLSAIFAAGIVIGAYALLAPRREDTPAPQPSYSLFIPPVDEVGEAYTRLSETARCDVVLAMTEFDDDHSRRIFELALDDASEAVVLAAIHGLARAGHRERVTDYVEEHRNDERACRLVETVGLLS
jgi:hypothetical protein